FYSSLGSQGEWISMDGGTYAWRPLGVDPAWRPYTDGYWVWTDDGWYWASDEPWAWATYHYGRWYNDDYYGWVWVPGYEWAPAWVEWRYGENCVGWAPLSPYAVFSASWGVHYRRYWATPYSYWSFVDCRYMGYHGLHGYVYRTDENARFISRTRTAGSVRYENGRIVTRGPEREFVEQRGNIRIPRTELVDVRERGGSGMTRSGGTGRIEVYRPRIDPGSRGMTATRPDRVRPDSPPVGLDIRGTDIRRGDDARQSVGASVSGPDVRRLDTRPEYRPEERRLAPAVRPSEPNISRDRPAVRPQDHPVIEPRPSRLERRPENVPAGRPERREQTVNGPRPGNWSQPQRTFNPGNTGRLSGTRTEPPSSERTGGSGRGGRR
ncbi:MAG TPA: DUF6600 domain-containing protein, partial [Bacteroidota bacterium]|nr:DUF6600 domain-containing protein [Bacteroidota bacterium]